MSTRGCAKCVAWQQEFNRTTVLQNTVDSTTVLWGVTQQAESFFERLSPNTGRRQNALTKV